MNNNELTVVKVSFQTIDEDKTSVKVIHDGFKDTNEWSEAFQWHQMAWVQVLNSLKAAIEKVKANCVVSLSNVIKKNLIYY